jgi:hypothetical protein
MISQYFMRGAVLVYGLFSATCGAGLCTSSGRSLSGFVLPAPETCRESFDFVLLLPVGRFLPLISEGEEWGPGKRAFC